MAAREGTCVAVIPKVVKAGFIVGGRHGEGLLSCRTDGAGADPPSSPSPGGSFAPGDLIAVFTDGLTEVDDASGEQFGLERLEAALAEERHRELAEIHAAVTGRVRSWGEARDDQTLG